MKRPPKRRRVSYITQKKVTNIKIDWTDKLKQNEEVLRHGEFVIQVHPVHGKSMYYQLELTKWDKSTFKKTESGVTHLTKNDRGNVVLRQIVASEKAAPQLLEKFLVYCGKFFIQHCEIPITIK